MKKYSVIIAALILFCPTFVYAQKSKSVFTADLYGGIYINNGQAWQIEPSISWNFYKYLGLTFGVELTRQYNQPSRQTVIDGYEAELVDNERNIGWVIFKPSLTIKTPAVWKSPDGNYRLWVQVEPGLSLACPFQNSLTYEIKNILGGIGQTVDYRKFPNQGLRWFYWNARTSVCFAVDRFVFRGGYYISNLDYYSGRRNITLANGNKYYVPKKELAKVSFYPLIMHYSPFENHKL